MEKSPDIATCLREISGFTENALLASFSTFKIGGPATYLVRPKTIQELQKVATCISAHKIPFAFLGGGSNVLIADSGFNGVVIIPSFTDVVFTETKVRVGAHVGLQNLLHQCAAKALSGVEHLAGIPGSVGGAVVGNVGTPIRWINEAVFEVETVHMPSGNAQTFSNAECQFGYRTSKFKDSTDWCVAYVTLTLQHDDKKNIQKRMQDLIIKRNHQPAGNACAGCIFKNPENQSAGMIIDQCGLKGKKIGGAMVSPDHGNFIVNTGTATAEDVMILISYIKQQVRDARGIQLHEEIRTIGF